MKYSVTVKKNELYLHTVACMNLINLICTYLKPEVVEVIPGGEPFLTDFLSFYPNKYTPVTHHSHAREERSKRSRIWLYSLINSII